MINRQKQIPLLLCFNLNFALRRGRVERWLTRTDILDAIETFPDVAFDNPTLTAMVMGLIQSMATIGSVFYDLVIQA